MIFRAKQLIHIQMTQVLTITQLGNPILQQKALEIDNLLDSDCQNLRDSLITTVPAAHGVGIAAPQVAWIEVDYCERNDREIRQVFSDFVGSI